MSLETNIRLSKATKEILALRGSKKDTYNSIIQKLLEKD